MESDFIVTVRKMGGSSAKYGNCGYCGKPANEMYSKEYRRKYKRPDGTDGITGADCCGPSYGHEECLKHERV